MFGIGTVAELAQISVRTLRYYDELGLLRPRWVDPETGYRWYSAQQVYRLHRILALRDLGVRLAEIAVLLEGDLNVDELRGILRLRRAEAHDRMSAEATRLARVEARLNQLEVQTISSNDVVVKSVPPTWVIATTVEVPSGAEIAQAHAEHWPRLHAVLDELGRDSTPPSIAAETGTSPIRLILGLPVTDGASYQSDTVQSLELPGIERVAATVIHGDPNFLRGVRCTPSLGQGRWRRADRRIPRGLSRLRRSTSELGNRTTDRSWIGTRPVTATDKRLSTRSGGPVPVITTR